jgi:hypothetical protein
MLSIEVVINVADPSQVAVLFLLLYLLCGRGLLDNKGGKKKRKSRRRNRGILATITFFI